MNNSKAKIQGFKDRLLTEMRRDPKKASILGVLALVLLIIGGREVAKRVGLPKTGSAATAQIKGQSGGPSLQESGVTTETAGNVQDGVSGLHTPNEDMPELPVDRDIFTPKETYFPIERAKKPVQTVSATVVDPNARKEAVKREIQAQAQSLSLQSTVVGSVSTAIVNGRVLHVGDWINDFQVVKITSRYCQLEKSGIRVMLEMAN